MEKVLNVKDIIGGQFTCEDAILLKSNFSNDNDTITLDFTGIDEVPTTFFYNLFSDLLYTTDREKSFQHIKVKNLSDISNYNKVVQGTAIM
ncbi:STAS-like domain-containing protein [Clostridium arbusti]|uniref:STAS-like domain-containing protein n=1 Tax=Clostridium arbusti TaxID=1137848 RepID=UPI0002889584|nr:STAS-like domain-containing protein [Clostridium arbusti]